MSVFSAASLYGASFHGLKFKSKEHIWDYVTSGGKAKTAIKLFHICMVYQYSREKETEKFVKDISL